MALGGHFGLRLPLDVGGVGWVGGVGRVVDGGDLFVDAFVDFFDDFEIDESWMVSETSWLIVTGS